MAIRQFYFTHARPDIGMFTSICGVLIRDLRLSKHNIPNVRLNFVMQTTFVYNDSGIRWANRTDTCLSYALQRYCMMCQSQRQRQMKKEEHFSLTTSLAQCKL